LTSIGRPDISGAEVAFTAQPQGCDNCRSPYVTGVAGTIPRIVAPMVSNPATIRYNGGAITLLGDAADGNGRTAWHGEPSNPSELRPPDAISVTGAVGFVDGYVVVAASTQTGDALWLWNSGHAQWHKLVDTGSPVTELGWTR